jgi:hypothetical protein
MPTGAFHCFSSLMETWLDEEEVGSVAVGFSEPLSRELRINRL